MKLKVKKLHEDAQLPFKKHDTDAGWDLSFHSCEEKETCYDYTSHGKLFLKNGESVKINTGIAVKIPEGHVGLIFDRSGLGIQGVSRLAGVIDEDYTGELIVGLTKHPSTKVEHENNGPFKRKFKKNYAELTVGDRIAQLVIVPIPQLELEEVDSLDETDRGDGGFGSTGK